MGWNPDTGKPAEGVTTLDGKEAKDIFRHPDQCPYRLGT